MTAKSRGSSVLGVINFAYRKVKRENQTACKPYQVEIARFQVNFISRTTSGVMEGINNKAKLILRQAYGLKDFEMLHAC